ncbi:tryptophan 2,3-dioxygenase family protein [Pedobacter nyackensis]|uniref:Tryptophan 2,3-dioxygenase apoenzyme n=1 Tax=Pedobacter nyackensis TaxID=475255 RepID=A0A1W2F4N9_9SPHI|nr:tryptophan 2,3-dioxygenase family protein [Pedobacter nyackensis]SMD16883.1 Tryptophan 2,3-dioxygenase apoenzyme [Pedobacter nyackensis]
MEITPEVSERLSKLQQKFSAMGQDINAYLDGLLYADYLTYWDYIHLDTLLSLQSPKTHFPDEEIFIMYHQITELYFKLTLHECKQIARHPALTSSFFVERLKRINAYFTALVSSFDIMVDGMDKSQFLKFRMSLLPASGFQSGQYRMIEIYATDFIRLVDKSKREELKESTIEQQFEYIYWKYGASELSTGKQTLTLQQFIAKYAAKFLQLAKDNVHTNFAALYRKLVKEGQDVTALEEEMRKLDLFVNVEWPLSHYKSAVRYLEKDPVDIAATGGTNWQKYLPPRFQKRIFFPFLWSEALIEEWGKTWVMNVLKSYKQIEKID